MPHKCKRVEVLKKLSTHNKMLDYTTSQNSVMGHRCLQFISGWQTPFSGFPWSYAAADMDQKQAKNKCFISSATFLTILQAII